MTCVENCCIIFTKAEATRVFHPHDDALVMSFCMSNMTMHRMLVDNRSSVNFMFREAFNQLAMNSTHMKPTSTPLTSFTGMPIMPMGCVTLHVSMGKLSTGITHEFDFRVVDQPALYSAIIKRSTLNCFREVLLTYHQLMKFLTSGGVGRIRGDQGDSKSCCATMVIRSSQPDHSFMMVLGIKGNRGLSLWKNCWTLSFSLVMLHE